MASTGPALVGRDPALAALRAGWQAAAADQGRLVLVPGEPGIGKTALLRALAAEATGAGGLLLWGQCWDGDGVPAYWPWVQVLRPAVAAGGDAGEVARLLSPQASASPQAGDHFLLFDSVVRLLASLAGRQPVLVVLDDLQWADQESLRLLEFASRHLVAQRVLLLGGYRDEEASAPLRRLAGATEQVPLHGLPRGDVATLMTTLTGAPPPEATATDVWRRTGGNPFLVRELTRLQVAQGDYRSRTTSAPARLLESVRDILERRLAHLSQACADLLTVAAVTGPEIRVAVLARVAEAPGDLSDLLQEAAAARVLVEPAEPLAPYRFSHDLFRETILAGLNPDTRTRLHLAVGRALEALATEGSRVHAAELAAHFQAARLAAPDDAVRYSTLAAEEATVRLGFDEARDHYERALAAVSDPAGRLDLLLRLADARDRAGDAPGARTAYRDAAELARRLDDATSVARAAVGTHALGWRISHAESIALLEEAVRVLPDEPSALRARVLACLARDLHFSTYERDWERAVVLAEQAVDIAEQAADPATLAFCLLALHDSHWRPGTASERVSITAAIRSAADRAGDRDLSAQSRLLRATALMELGDPAGPGELEAYCRAAEDLGHMRARYGALSRRATLALLTGDLPAAEQLANQALSLGQRIGEPDARGVYETLMWAVRRAGGMWHRVALESDPWPGLPLAEAVMRVTEGDLSAAGRALARLPLEALHRRYDMEMFGFAAEALAAAGASEQRAGLYEMLLSYAGSHIVVGGCASYLGAVDHYLGLLARSLGRAEDARRHFTTAAELHDRLGAPVWADLSRAQARRAPDPEEWLFRRDGAVWTVRYRGSESHLPDTKGLRDLAVLLARPGEAVHALELHTGRPSQGSGADPVLDAPAKAAYRRRLAELDADIDQAEADHDPYRAEKARAERDALIAELSAAVGLGGRDRRLRDERERARKAVTARIREAIDRIHRTDRDLADHLNNSVRTGAWCVYQPAEPTHWRQ